MAVTLEAMDQVIERTGCTYKEAKEALERFNGDPVEAIIYLENNNVNEGQDFFARFRTGAQEPSGDDIAARIKEAIRKGNVERIVITRNGKELASFPVNIGAGAGMVAFFAFPVASIVAALVAFGSGCKLEIIKEDGTRTGL